MFTVAFWKDAAVRAIRTGAAVLLVAIGADGAGIVGLDWGGTATLTVGGMLATILAAIVAPTADQKAKKDDLP